jgi:ribosome-binding factor A
MSSEESIRPLRVAELIRSILIQVINQGKAQDMRIFNTNLTITAVKMSKDLKVANCYVRPFASKLSEAELMDAFDKSKAHLRILVSDRIKLKYSPELRFFYDRGHENAEKVEKILKDVAPTTE